MACQERRCYYCNKATTRGIYCSRECTNSFHNAKMRARRRGESDIKKKYSIPDSREVDSIIFGVSRATEDTSYVFAFSSDIRDWIKSKKIPYSKDNYLKRKELKVHKLNTIDHG